LKVDRLVREPGGVIIAARLQVKGGSFRDLPLTTELSESLEDGSLSWKASKACGCGGVGSQLHGIRARLSWLGRRAL
jgi:hypothetical protein